MKNALVHNYNLLDPKIFFYERKTFVVDNNNKYELVKLDSQYQFEALKDISNELRSENYGQIIKTINNTPTMEYNRKIYALIKKNNVSKSIIEILDEESNRNISIDSSKTKNTSWFELWCKKNDNIEYTYKLTKGKNKIIDESIAYFLGMAETAIAYYKEIDNTEKRLTISHRRVEEIDNPLNIIIDEKERDVSEYLKYIFFNNKNYYNEIKSVNELIIKHQLSYEKIYARMLYPTFYFDELEKYDTDRNSLQTISKIVSRVDEYERYLNYLHRFFSQKKVIKKIDWLS